MSQIILAGTPKRQKFIMYLYAYICAKTLLFCKVSYMVSGRFLYQR